MTATKPVSATGKGNGQMKKRIVSFRDLEVYQGTYGGCVEVVTRVIPKIPDFEKNDLKSQLRRSVKAIPS
jgi:hypothetical protein